uniref:thiamine phosphate synthase n=1 Tax=uncultured Oscillibacter sp. TaxID=876091 RepID=UPI0026229C76
MSDILCVTSRQLCREDFLARLERIAAARPAGIVLREKDLSPAAYRALAGQVLEICRRRGVPCILHAFPDIAEELGADGLHLPLPALRLLSPESRKRFRRLGASDVTHCDDRAYDTYYSQRI